MRQVPPKRRFLQEPRGVTSQDAVLHSYRHENLKSYIQLILFLAAVCLTVVMVLEAAVLVTNTRG
jgi:hypothetical protein